MCIRDSLQTTLSWSEGTEAVGLMIHTDDELRKWCQLRLEVRHGKILMDRYNRVDGDQYYLDERPVADVYKRQSSTCTALRYIPQEISLIPMYTVSV